MTRKFNINEQPLAVQVKFSLTEWARPELLKSDYVRMRNALRRNPDMPTEDLKALIEEAKLACRIAQRPKWKTED